MSVTFRKEPVMNNEGTPMQPPAIPAEPTAPPTVWPGLRVKPPRSKWPAVVGIIAIVIGAGGFLYNACGAVGAFVVGMVFQRMPSTGMPPEVFQVKPGWVGVMLVMSLLCGVLLIPGIALLQRRRWSAAWLRIWSVAAIVLAVAGSVIEARIQGENMTRMMTATSMPAGAGPSPAFFQATAIGGAVFNAVLRCAFPVFLLIWFTRRKIRDEVAAWTAPSV
jgi:hypothetical protein